MKTRTKLLFGTAVIAGLMLAKATSFAGPTTCHEHDNLGHHCHAAEAMASLRLVADLPQGAPSAQRSGHALIQAYIDDRIADDDDIRHYADITIHTAEMERQATSPWWKFWSRDGGVSNDMFDDAVNITNRGHGHE